MWLCPLPSNACARPPPTQYDEIFYGMLEASGNMGELVVHTEMKLDFEMDGGVVG